MISPALFRIQRSSYTSSFEALVTNGGLLSEPLAGPAFSQQTSSKPQAYSIVTCALCAVETYISNSDM